VQGLSIGSPVTFKGVQIGEVTNISLTFNPGEMKLAIPVRAVLYPEKIHVNHGERRIENLNRAIEKGLRAQLQTQSLITGQLMITLDFYPDTPAQLRGDGTLLEIPTSASVIEQLAQVLKSIRFDEILDKLNRSADGLEKLINNPDLLAGIKNLNTTVQDVQTLVRTLNDRVGPLAGSITGAADEYGSLAKNLNTELANISGALEKTLASAQTTAGMMEKTLANSAAITSDGSPVMHELTRSLRELSDAARKPESVIFGKGDSR
jgi:paraquat-inducible protein B